MINNSEKKWLLYTFDSPETAIELEGMHGSGDSGGPSVIFENKIPYLVGLSSWQKLSGDFSKVKSGLYGTSAYQTRVSSYVNWINENIKSN